MSANEETLIPKPTPISEEQSHTRCICGHPTDDPEFDGGMMVMCETCEHWQHAKCVNVEEDNIPEHYYCARCNPNEQSHTRCICGHPTDDPEFDGGMMVMCETCEHWQHANCVNVEEDNIPEHYYCARCKPGAPATA